MEQADMRYISKMFSAGWRICIRRDGEPAYEYFTFANYGGEDEALKAAKERRDEILRTRRLAPRRKGRHGFYAKRVDSPAGICGITLHFYKNSRGYFYVAWALKKWLAGEVNNNVYFSIRKHGYVGGWRRALKERAKDTGQKLLDTPPPPPTAQLKQWAKQHGIDLST